MVWAVNESNNTEGTWRYGRVSLPSITKHRVSTFLQVCLHYIQFTKHDQTILVWFSKMCCIVMLICLFVIPF